MGVIFIISTFVLFFLSYLLAEKTESVFSNIRLAFIKSSLTICLLVVIFTESLSFYNCISSTFIILFWAIISVGSISIFIYITRRSNTKLLKSVLRRIIDFYKILSLFDKLYLALTGIILVTLFFTSFCINSNWDSYTYHLPRVEHWIQHKNTDFYPTNDIRQLYFAPFSEYFVLNLKLLSGNSAFVNLVQFFSWFNCLLLVSLIAKQFNLNYKGQILAIVFASTIPMGILQATTTQTDLVVSFFLVSFVYFGYSLLTSKVYSFNNIFFMSTSLSLGILTKATFIIFASPFCLIFGLLLLKRFKYKALRILIIATLTIILINGFFLWRNYEQFGSPLGPQKKTSYFIASANEEMGFKVMASNSIKNLGLHLSVPLNSWNSAIDKIVSAFHDFMNFPLNARTTNLYNCNYKTTFILHHDGVGNFSYTVLFLLSLIYLIIRAKAHSGLVLTFILSILIGFFFFAYILKWQTWQTRLDLPLFFLISPVLAYFLFLLKRETITNLIGMAFLTVAILVLFIFEPIKPVFGKNSLFLKNSNSYILGYNSASKIATELASNRIRNVGLILGNDSWEWQYWLLSKNVRFEYIYFHNDFTQTVNFDPDYKYSAIIIENDFLCLPSLKNQVINTGQVPKIVPIDAKTTLLIFNTEINNYITYQ